MNNDEFCPYACEKRDCDGDWDTYCCSQKEEDCGYQRKVRDCDGDIIFLCRK